MRKEEFYYDSRDGKSKLHAVRWMPENPDAIVGVVQIVHGMAEYVARYEEFSLFLTERGFVVTGEDHMGHGKSVGKIGVCGYFCEQDPATVLVRDVHRLKKATQALYPQVPYIILGHSMGSFITRNYMFRYGTGIRAAVILGTGMPTMALLSIPKAVAVVQRFFMGSEHVSRLIDKLVFGNYNKKIDNARTSADWLSRDEAKVDGYLADPMCGFTFTVNGFSTLFELIGRLYDRQNLERIPKTLPTYIVSGTGDPVGDYGKGVQKTYDSLKSVGMENVELKLYEGSRHELLNETNRDEVMEDICEWLKKNVLEQTERQE